VEDKIYFSGSSGNFEEWFIPKTTKKSPPKLEKILKNSEHWIYISKFGMFGNDTENWYLILKNKNKKRKVSTNFWKFSEIFIFFIFKCSKRKLNIFEVLGEFWRGPRVSEEWKNLFLEESRSEKRSGTLRNEGRGIPRAIPTL
jgi:hypothetical protein